MNDFLPTTQEELARLRWTSLDVILVTGDSYIDSPFIGIAIIGKVLQNAGYRVGIIAQPDVHSAVDITRLGEPTLFWGVTGGSLDSMVANTTASGKPRKQDDFTPGGINNRRPDRAVIVYANLIRRYFKHTKPIVLGGVEASLRRVAHYDFWSDRIRAPILFDAKADYLLYGMAEKSVLEFAEKLSTGKDVQGVRGLCYLTKEERQDYTKLPAYEETIADKNAFVEMFHVFYNNTDPLSAKGLCQRKGDRFLIQNPPALPLSQTDLDAIYALNYQRAQHPFYEAQGRVKALETIKFSVATHRGCYGECNFCAIAVHEGRTVTWRSQDSIVSEVESLTRHPDFKGYIQDISGPTANMYGYECVKKLERGICLDKRCLYPNICPVLNVDHSQHLALLRRIRNITGVKKVFVSSGIRYDLLAHDDRFGEEYLREIVKYHVSGQLKVAPEHTQECVLKLMGKTGTGDLIPFKEKFDALNRALGKKQYLT